MKVTTAALSIISLLSTYWIHPVYSLRNVRRNKENGVKQQRQATEEEPVECYVTEMHGVSLDQPDLPSILTCVSINSETEIIYSLYGETDDFFYDVDIQGGNVKLTVPQDAIGADGIKVSTATMDEISMEIDEERRRKLESGVGVKKVVVVRVSNDSSSDRRVNQSPWQLYTDIFTDENNAASVYNDCSKGNLRLEPVQQIPGYYISNGVLNVNAPDDICGKHWLTAWNDLGLEQNIVGSNLADLAMIVMPDCVNWDNAAGWGQTPGKITWFPTEYASLPMTQVHELGHNFGHRHSGKGGITYADPTGYMGNRALWTDEGSKMCFNGAKTWFFGWFSEYHETVTLSSSSYTGTIIGASEMNWSDTIIVKVVAEANYNDDLYITFNSATGANSGVTGNPNQVIITEQGDAYQESTWKAGLFVRQQWSTSWNSRTLVVINCGVSWGTPRKATIIVAYSDDSSALDCQAIEVPDAPPNDSPPNNSNPDQTGGNTPIKYDDSSLFSAASGLLLPPESNAGIVSTSTSTKTTCIDIPGWHDSDGLYCDSYDSDNSEVQCKHAYNHPNQGHSAMTACCVCGGGEEITLNKIGVDDECIDEPGWSDSGGEGCPWYEGYGSRCMNLGDSYANESGKTANDACCYCKENRYKS